MLWSVDIFQWYLRGTYCFYYVFFFQVVKLYTYMCIYDRSLTVYYVLSCYLLQSEIRNVVGHESGSRFIPGSQSTFWAQAMRELTTRNNSVSLARLLLFISVSVYYWTFYLVFLCCCSIFFLSPSTNKNNHFLYVEIQ